MEQENLNNEQINAVEKGNATDYINAIKQLKENSVSKTEYETLQEEKSELLKALIDGTTVQKAEEKTPVDIVKLERGLWAESNNRTNLENFSDLLTLRNELISRGENDIFLPYGMTPTGEKVLPTAEDEEKAEHLAEYLQHCIDEADGDPAIFQNEFQRNLY